MKLTKEQKRLREVLAETLYHGNPRRGRKAAVREAKAMVREALAEQAANSAEALAALPAHELAARIYRATVPR